MSKINWLQAKKDYLIDETLSYQDIASKYDVALTVVKRRALEEKWTKLRQEVNQKVTEKLLEEISESITQYQARKFNEGRILSNLGFKVLAIRSSTISTKTAKEMVDTGYKLQTEALGLDNPKIQYQANVKANSNLMTFADIVVAMRKRVEEEEKNNE